MLKRPRIRSRSLVQLPWWSLALQLEWSCRGKYFHACPSCRHLNRYLNVIQVKYVFSFKYRHLHLFSVAFPNSSDWQAFDWFDHRSIRWWGPKPGWYRSKWHQCRVSLAQRGWFMLFCFYSYRCSLNVRTWPESLISWLWSFKLGHRFLLAAFQDFIALVRFSRLDRSVLRPSPMLLSFAQGSPCSAFCF